METIRPGPIDPSVLKLQSSHRSESVWRGEPDKPMSCRIHLLSMGSSWEIDDRVLHYVRLAGFFGVHRVSGGGVLLDRALITALLERWRKETHTFHLVVGEATITLQDVAVLFGLNVHGDAVTGHGAMQWADLVEELLGVRPVSDEKGKKKVLKGSTINLSWLKRNFRELPADASDKVVREFSRAYILMLMGTVLFPNKSGNSVSLQFLPLLRKLEDAGTYSWGSATLAYLYRHLCRACEKGKTELGGPLILMQLWSWEHIHIGVPQICRVRKPKPDQPEDVDDPQIFGSQHQRHIDPLACTWLRVYMSGTHKAKGLAYYRDALDHQQKNQMTWQPYSEDILRQLPEICRSHPHIWRTRAPLICFEIVEFYYPDRVLRQFGLEQPIPAPCDTSEKLHRVDGRAIEKNYQKLHSTYIIQWNNREKNIVSGMPLTEHSTSDYMTWYRRITRLLLSPPSLQRPTSHYQPATADHILVKTLADIASRCSQAITTSGDLPPDKALPFALETLRGLASTSVQTLTNIGQGHQVEHCAVGTTTPTNTGPEPPRSKIPPRRSAKRSKAPRGSGSTKRIPSTSTSTSEPCTPSPFQASSASTSNIPDTSPYPSTNPENATNHSPAEDHTPLQQTPPTSAPMFETPMFETAKTSGVPSPPHRPAMHLRSSTLAASLDTIDEVDETNVAESSPRKKKKGTS